MQYGSFGDPAMGGDDTLEAQREAEALQRVVAKTTKSVPCPSAHPPLLGGARQNSGLTHVGSNMVDVFEIAPHDVLTRAGGNPTPFAYAGQGARVARYQHLVSRLDADHEGGIRVDWLTDEEDALDSQSNRPASIKTLPEENGGATLVGTFADAAAAMQ